MMPHNHSKTPSQKKKKPTPPSSLLCITKQIVFSTPSAARIVMQKCHGRQHSSETMSIHCSLPLNYNFNLLLGLLSYMYTSTTTNSKFFFFFHNKKTVSLYESAVCIHKNNTLKKNKKKNKGRELPGNNLRSKILVLEDSEEKKKIINERDRKSVV